MALAAKISALELSQQVQDRFVDQYFEARLINAPGEVYTPGTTDDAVFLANEAVEGVAGYRRQILYYRAQDVANYTDGGVGLAQKATVFAHDGGEVSYNFTHAALCWSTGNILTLDPITVGDVPTTATNGTYLNIPFDSTTGSAQQVTFDIVVINSGADITDYAISINKPGYGAAAGDEFTINDGTLALSGLGTPGSGDIVITAATVFDSPKSGQLIATARTSNVVTLGAGNEAAFYWNIKQYGYYESLLAS